MANPEHLNLLNRGVTLWNEWRIEADVRPDLSGADLSHRSLLEVNFIDANLSMSKLTGTYLHDAVLMDADLSGAEMEGATLEWANLFGAVLKCAKASYADFSHADMHQSDARGSNFCGAQFDDADLREVRLEDAILDHAVLRGANLQKANLHGASLRGATLIEAHLLSADLSNADLNEAAVGYTNFADTDLSGAIGLETLHHSGPSPLALDTLYKCKGRIPEELLAGCGVPPDYTTYLHSLLNSPIQWHSCFISHSTKDEEFARRLHGRMRQANLRVWYAPEELKGGKKLYEQLNEAIQLNDKTLIILSKDSIGSDWVKTEIRKAREVERRQQRRKLFPIRLVDFETLRAWTCFDGDAGKDLAVELREYFIPDFSNWKDHDAFEAAFARLQKDLRAEERKTNE